MLKGCPFYIEDQVMEVDLIMFYLFELDMILDMDWFVANHTFVDRYSKEVMFRCLAYQRWCFVESIGGLH